MFSDVRLDIMTAQMLVTGSSDVSAIPEVRGDRLVVRRLALVDGADREASVPICDGYVSAQELEAALRRIGAFME